MCKQTSKKPLLWPVRSCGFVAACRESLRQEGMEPNGLSLSENTSQTCLGCRMQFFFHCLHYASCQEEGLGKNLSSWQSQAGCLCLTSAFPSPNRYIAFLLCCLSLIDAVICVLRQPELINPSKYPVIRKGSHLQLQGGEKDSLCFCLLAVLVQDVPFEAGDSAWVCGVSEELSVSKGISRAGRGFKGSNLQKLRYLCLHCEDWQCGDRHL